MLTVADKKLWRIALPMILSNISVPLLGLVDTAVIGHLNSPVFLAGVAVGTTVTSFLFMLLLFLRMSTTGMTAQAFGAKDSQGLARALGQPLCLALLAGVVLLFFRQPVSHTGAAVIGGDPQVLRQACLFMHVRWLSAPATLANLVILGWLLGVQYARAPVILLIVGNAVNIVFDVIFVTGLGWQVRGVAAATVIAEYITLLMGLLMIQQVLQKHNIPVRQIFQGWKGSFQRIMRLNRDIMFRSLLLQLCFASLTLLGAHMGDNIVAVNAVLLMFLTFTAYALDGFAYAVESCAGEAFGMRDKNQLINLWRAACRQAGLVALIFSFIYAFFGQRIVALLTSLPEIRYLANRYFLWQIILPLVGVWCYLLDGMFTGATRGRDMRNSMIVAASGYGVALFSVPLIGNHGLWLALTVFLLLRGLLLWKIWQGHWRAQSWFDISQ